MTELTYREQLLQSIRLNLEYLVNLNAAICDRFTQGENAAAEDMIQSISELIESIDPIMALQPGDADLNDIDIRIANKIGEVELFMHQHNIPAVDATPEVVPAPRSNNSGSGMGP